MVVLDSSALLAALYREPGAEVVVRHLDDDPVITAVNLEESLRVLINRGLPAQVASRALSELGIEVIDYTAEMADASVLRMPQALPGLGLADRCCLSAAADRRAPVLTADRAWGELGRTLGVDVVLIR